jgi:hypothetical protein
LISDPILVKKEYHEAQKLLRNQLTPYLEKKNGNTVMAAITIFFSIKNVISDPKLVKPLPIKKMARKCSFLG